MRWTKLLNPIVLVLSFTAVTLAQGISSSTCYGTGGPTGSSWVFGTYNGALDCSCAAHCTNGRNISAYYYIYWSCNLAKTGSIIWVPLSYSIKVSGSVLDVATNIYGNSSGG